MSAVDRAFDDALEALKKRYLAKLPAAIDELKKFAVLCDLGEPGADAISAAAALAHRLNGSGETLGFPEISRTAVTLEQLLQLPGSPDGSTAAAARALARACSTAAGPQDKPAAAASAAEAQAPPTASADKPALPVLLAIHSDAGFARMSKDVFAGRAEIKILSGCTEAFSTLASAALVLVDLDSPGCASEPLAALYAQACAARVPVLAMTAQRRSATVFHALSAGRAECLVKPVEPALLYRKVFDTLERQRLVAVICDDDPVVREFLKPRFEARGFTVILANDGEELLGLAASARPSIIVLDRSMPKLGGLDALRMLKANAATATIPVVLLTSKNQPQDKADGLRSGAAAYLTKPFAPDTVLAKCFEILGAPISRK